MDLALNDIFKQARLHIGFQLMLKARHAFLQTGTESGGKYFLHFT